MFYKISVEITSVHSTRTPGIYHVLDCYVLRRRTQSSQEPHVLKRKDYAHTGNTTRNSTTNSHWGDMHGSVETQRRCNLMVKYYLWVGEKKYDIGVQAGGMASTWMNQSGHQMVCVMGQLGQVSHLQAITLARRWLAMEGGTTGLKGTWPPNYK